jgi:hypothetical protein
MHQKGFFRTKDASELMAFSPMSPIQHENGVDCFTNFYFGCIEQFPPSSSLSIHPSIHRYSTLYSDVDDETRVTQPEYKGLLIETCGFNLHIILLLMMGQAPTGSEQLNFNLVITFGIELFFVCYCCCWIVCCQLPPMGGGNDDDGDDDGDDDDDDVASADDDGGCIWFSRISELERCGKQQNINEN